MRLTALQAWVHASTVRRAVSTGIASFSLRVRAISINPVRIPPLARFSRVCHGPAAYPHWLRLLVACHRRFVRPRSYVGPRNAQCRVAETMPVECFVNATGAERMTSDSARATAPLAGAGLFAALGWGALTGRSLPFMHWASS
jgi:hypothetical protein